MKKYGKIWGKKEQTKENIQENRRKVGYRLEKKTGKQININGLGKNQLLQVEYILLVFSWGSRKNSFYLQIRVHPDWNFCIVEKLKNKGFLLRSGLVTQYEYLILSYFLDGR